MLKRMLDSESNKVIKEYLADIHAHDLAELFIELSDEDKHKVYRLLTNEKLADLVSYLELDVAALVLSDFDLDKQKKLVEMMEPDDATDIIMELEDDEQKELLNALGKDSDVVQLIAYDDSATGSAMTNQMVVLFPEMEVKPATKKVIEEAHDAESINTLFITDHNQMFLGIVPLRKLIKAKTPCYISELIEYCPTVKDTDSITQTLEAINNYSIFEMPVCDEHNKLLGMITLDDALDIYQEEAQEDFEKLSGLPETLEINSFKTAFHRIPWLLLLLAISVPIAMITSHYERVITAAAILVIFQPLISGSAGNVATQTLAVTLKMFSTNEKGFAKNAVREILTGMMNGFVIGSIAFGTTFAFTSFNTSTSEEPIKIALIVGASLWVTIFIAPIIAITIPSILKFFKFDPAVASGPFITTLIDMTALSIYFGLAAFVFGGF